MNIQISDVGSVITSDAGDTHPRDYVSKHLAIAKARSDYNREAVAFSKTALSDRLEMESATTAYINRIGKNGLRSPEPHLTYNKSLQIDNAYAAMAQAERRFEALV